jgi:hypothetical protein
MLLNPIRIATNCWLITAHTIDNNLRVFRTRFTLVKFQHKIIHQCVAWLPPTLAVALSRRTYTAPSIKVNFEVSTHFRTNVFGVIAILGAESSRPFIERGNRGVGYLL